jgi:glyoxylase-like metal-dependent hydrolase (beta-lactamase superfamily II)
LHPQSGDNPLGDYLSSLTALKRLDVELILPAHEHIFSNFEARIEQLLEFHEERKSEILHVLQRGAKTGYQTAAKIRWIINGAVVPFEELSPLDRRLAAMEALAYLELLLREGKVDKVLRDVILYST